MNACLKLKLEIESAWMTIANPDMSVQEAIEKLTRMGNQVVEVDHEQRRLRIRAN
jgi:hypothetical protein